MNLISHVESTSTKWKAGTGQEVADTPEGEEARAG